MNASEVERTSVVNNSSITNPSDNNSSGNSSSSDSDDIEWAPASVSSGRTTRAAASPSKSVTQRKPRKKSLKTEDRRLRKKEQNKTAATRYRIKKKVELEILLEEEAVLEQHNRKLQKRHDDLANEVKYLKKLMRELFTSRSVKRL
jgi:cyclic AMP-dependent transcription factor ATF-4